MVHGPSVSRHAPSFFSFAMPMGSSFAGIFAALLLLAGHFDGGASPKAAFAQERTRVTGKKIIRVQNSTEPCTPDKKARRRADGGAPEIGRRRHGPGTWVFGPAGMLAPSPRPMPGSGASRLPSSLSYQWLWSLRLWLAFPFFSSLVLLSRTVKYTSPGAKVWFLRGPYT